MFQELFSSRCYGGDSLSFSPSTWLSREFGLDGFFWEFGFGKKISIDVWMLIFQFLKGTFLFSPHIHHIIAHVLVVTILVFAGH